MACHLEDILTAFTEKYRKNKVLTSCLAEATGTFLLVFFGLGFTANAVLVNAPIDLFGGAFLWGLALTLGIYVTASISTAHLNPAVSIALSVFRSKEFTPRMCVWYIISQIIGAFLGALLVFGLFNDFLVAYEQENNIVRGSVASIGQEMIYGEFFPNPAIIPHTVGNSALLPGGSIQHAFAMEFVGTLLLMFLILAIVDRNQNTLKHKELVPLIIGLSLMSIVSVVAPSTEACINPARDFGARLVAVMMGYGKVALPGPRNEMWVYIFAPILGALVGALFHDLLIAPGLRRTAKPYVTYQAKVHDLQLQRSLRDILSNQRSNDDISSPTSGGGLTLQQQTQLLAILAGAAFQGGKQEETVEAEARPA
eukprot:evm.model.NODE_28821_length_16656_cov_25.076488.3